MSISSLQQVSDMDMDKGWTLAKSKKSHGKKSKKLEPSIASDIIGRNIRNAVSGSYYEEKVGSPDENKFWKVSRKSDVKFDDDHNMVADGFDMSAYFYDSPKQYEQHRNTVLKQSVKDIWYARNCALPTVTACGVCGLAGHTFDKCTLLRDELVKKHKHKYLKQYLTEKEVDSEED